MSGSVDAVRNSVSCAEKRYGATGDGDDDESGVSFDLECPKGTLNS